MSLLAKDEKTRDLIRKELSNNGIETRPFFFPAHTMPMYFDEKRSEKFPVAEALSKRGINLPSYPSLTEKEVDEICNLIIKALN